MKGTLIEYECKECGHNKAYIYYEVMPVMRRYIEMNEECQIIECEKCGYQIINY